MDDKLLYIATPTRRPPDWRWQLGCYLKDKKIKLGRSRGDRGVSQAREFAIALDGIKNDFDQLYLAEREPKLFEAWSLHQGYISRNARWELEARLLSGESIEQVTTKTGLSKETITTYGSIFFDVKDKPNGYIMHVVLAEAAKRGISEREPDMLWKLFAYWSGSEMVDQLVYRFGSGSKLAPGASVAAFLADDFRQQLQLKSNIAIRSMQITGQTQIEIANLYLKMIELEKTAGGSAAGQESFAAGVQSLLENLPWTRNATVAARRNLTSDLERNGAGLRADELLLAAAGQTPAGLAEALASAKFPPRLKTTSVTN